MRLSLAETVSLVFGQTGVVAARCTPDVRHQCLIPTPSDLLHGAGTSKRRYRALSAAQPWGANEGADFDDLVPEATTAHREAAELCSVSGGDRLRLQSVAQLDFAEGDLGRPGQ